MTATLLDNNCATVALTESAAVIGVAEPGVIAAANAGSTVEAARWKLIDILLTSAARKSFSQ